MRRIALLLLVTTVPAATAHAGGWATVELDRAPTGLVAGEPWRVELIVKQHGRTPLAGAAPSVQIANDSGVVRTFRARPTGRVGTYVAEVTFPSGGTWRTRIYDGWTDAVPHRLGPLTVAPGAAELTGGFPWPQAVAIAVVALLWTGGWIAGWGWPHPHVWRRRRPGAPRRYLPAR
jgi:hypothetical protein